MGKVVPVRGCVGRSVGGLVLPSLISVDVRCASQGGDGRAGLNCWGKKVRGAMPGYIEIRGSSAAVVVLWRHLLCLRCIFLEEGHLLQRG
jgi:hypothetical protein